jgi:hypothetical protein
MKKQYTELTDEEREEYNLPPKGFQGNEFTIVIQAPTKLTLQKKIADFHSFALKEGYGSFSILSQGPDPDGGFKAVVAAHNSNPLTWASEQFHRARLGARSSWSQGAKKARIKHDVSQRGDLAATYATEVALQKARLARIEAAAPERIATERLIGAEKEKMRRERILEELQQPRPDYF